MCKLKSYMLVTPPPSTSRLLSRVPASTNQGVRSRFCFILFHSDAAYLQGNGVYTLSHSHFPLHLSLSLSLSHPHTHAHTHTHTHTFGLYLSLYFQHQIIITNESDAVLNVYFRESRYLLVGETSQGRRFW